MHFIFKMISKSTRLNFKYNNSSLDIVKECNIYNVNIIWLWDYYYYLQIGTVYTELPVIMQPVLLLLL